MNRTKWLISQIKKYDYKIGAELGVQLGKNLFEIKEAFPDELILYGIDIWSDKQVRFDGTMDLTNIKPNAAWGTVNDKWQKLKNPDQVKLIRDFTSNASRKFEDESLDFIFIDASHQYDEVYLDIKLWKSKVRKGGLISGHDIHMKGVVKAVNQLLPGWQKAGGDNVWFIRKE